MRYLESDAAADPGLRDQFLAAAIQAFEFTYELSFKFMKRQIGILARHVPDCEIRVMGSRVSEGPRTSPRALSRSLPGTLACAWAASPSTAPATGVGGATLRFHASTTTSSKETLPTSGDGERGSVYVQPLTATGARYRISPLGGRHAVWSHGGTELLYVVPGVNRFEAKVPTK